MSSSMASRYSCSSTVASPSLSISLNHALASSSLMVWHMPVARWSTSSISMLPLSSPSRAWNTTRRASDRSMTHFFASALATVSAVLRVRVSMTPISAQPIRKSTDPLLDSASARV